MKPLMILFILIITAGLPLNVSGAALGVTKAVLTFENVLKNGYAEDSFYVSTDSPNNISLYVNFSGTVGNWLSLKEEKDMFISRNHGQWITVVVRPPADVQNGKYDGLVRVTTGALSKDIQGRFGSQILASFGIAVDITITGREIISCIPGGIAIPDTEIGKPVEIRYGVQNNGNVRVAPTARLDIWDQTRSNLIRSASIPGIKEILPTTVEGYNGQITDLALPVGQYFVDVTISPCTAESQELTFMVLEKGAVSDRGELLRIENPYFGTVGEITPIRAFFRNNGNRTVSAKFKGTVRFGGAVMKVIETDSLDVLPFETLPLEAYFQPDKTGMYTIQGRVLYNSKLTFEKGSLLEVQEASKEAQKKGQQGRITLASFVPVIIILIMILVLLILIKRRKKGTYNRHRIIRS